MGSFSRPFAKISRTFASVLGRRGGNRRLGNPVSINGTFVDATGWTLDVSCAIDTGSLHCANATANTVCSYATSQPAGTYNISYDVVSQNQGNVIFRINTNGGGVISGVTRLNPITPGTYTEDITVGFPVQAWEVRCTRSNSLMDVRIDNIVIRPYIED